MKNIVFYWGNIPEPQFGGIDRVTCVWANLFKKKGYNVYLVYSGGEERLTPSCFVKKFKWEKPELSYKELKCFFEDNNITVCINQRYCDPNIIKQLYKASFESGCKIYTVFHSMPGSEFYKKEGFRGFKKILWNTLNRKKICQHYQDVITYSDKIILLSPSYIPLFMKVYAINQKLKNKLISIPNPCSFDIETLEPGQKENIVLVVSRLLEEQKRISLILKIWERIKNADKWSLVIVGDGKDRINYETYIKKRNIQGVYFLGRQDPVSYYKKAKIFLMTSSYEGWPLTLLESMQFGDIPIVFNSCTVFADIIKSGQDGFLVENNNLKEYKTIVENLMSSDEKMNMLSRNAWNTANKYEPDVLFTYWRDLFE